MSVSDDILASANRLPPFLAYALAMRARHPRNRLETLVNASGLHIRTFCRIAAQTSWEGIRLGHMSAFCQACGVNPFRPGKHVLYLQHTIQREDDRSFAHLKPAQKAKLKRQLAEVLGANPTN